MFIIVVPRRSLHYLWSTEEIYKDIFSFSFLFVLLSGNFVIYLANAEKYCLTDNVLRHSGAQRSIITYHSSHVKRKDGLCV